MRNRQSSSLLVVYGIFYPIAIIAILYLSIKNIALALDDAGDAAAKHIAVDESRHQLTQQKELKNKLESGFEAINLGKHEEEVNLKDQCFWVPASVHHEVRKEGTTGLARYSFFVYGGVNIQPRMNIVPGGGGPLGGNAVGGGAFNRTEMTRGFQEHHIVSHSNDATKNNQLFQLAGIDINSRVNKIFLPKDPSLHETRSIHSGRHTNSYSEKVKWQMDDLVRQGQAADWTKEQYRAATRTLLSELRQEFRAGNIGLNVHHRPWATKW